MSTRTRCGWIGIVVVALVAAAGAFTGPVLKYSSGWHEETIDGLPTSCWQSGICDTFYTYVFLQPSRDIGVIMFANAAGDNNATQAMFTELSKIAALYAAP